MLAPLEAWLVGEARLLPDPVDAVSGLVTRMAEAGFEPMQLAVIWHTLHPLIDAQSFRWAQHRVASNRVAGSAPLVESSLHDAAGGVVHHAAVAHGAFESEGFRASPFFALRAGAPMVRCRIRPDDTGFAYPVLRDLQLAGGTDYLAVPLRFSAGRYGFHSVATRRPDGFSDAQIAALTALSPALGASFEPHVANHVARTLLETYVGRLTGARVLAGQIRSGDVERLEAAIWFSDLRGFTALSATAEPAELITWLNRYFAAICAPLAAHGGEILKFIGDAVLAVFPVHSDAPTICRAARAAAAQAHVRLDALNAERAQLSWPPLDHGIALHLGEVQYGNIGAESRLDFTVIGPAVNLASRLEGLCGRLGRRTVMSGRFAAEAGPGLVPLGRFELKGVAQPEDAFGEP